MTRISLDGLETGPDDLDDFVVTMRYKRSQSGADTFLIVGNQHPHTRGQCRRFCASAASNYATQFERMPMAGLEPARAVKPNGF